MRKVAISMITPDMVLARTLFHNNTIMLHTGTTRLDRFVSNLDNLGISSIFVNDIVSDGIEIPDVISDTTRSKCRTVLYNTYSFLASSGSLILDDVSHQVENILDEILSNSTVLLSLNDIGSTDDSTFVHSVNMTIYSLILAQQLNFSKSELKKLALGTILHDVGKIVLDQKILYKPDHFNKEEFEHVKQHTLLGYGILQKNTNLTRLSRMIASTHHERLDGSGYPNGLKGDEIHIFSRIAAIADVYDALTSERCYHQKLSPSQAVDMLVADSASKLDASLLAQFIKRLAIYPNGSTILLSNGEYAVVKEQNQDLPYRPIVRIFKPHAGSYIPMHEIDLSKELNLTIVDDNITHLNFD